jgi:hypothetical protein
MRKVQSSGSKSATNVIKGRSNDLKDSLKIQSMLQALAKILCAHYVEEKAHYSRAENFRISRKNKGVDKYARLRLASIALA